MAAVEQTNAYCLERFPPNGRYTMGRMVFWGNAESSMQPHGERRPLPRRPAESATARKEWAGESVLCGMVVSWQNGSVSPTLGSGHTNSNTRSIDEREGRSSARLRQTQLPSGHALTRGSSASQQKYTRTATLEAVALARSATLECQIIEPQAAGSGVRPAHGDSRGEERENRAQRFERSE